MEFNYLHEIQNHNIIFPVVYAVIITRARAECNCVWAGKSDYSHSQAYLRRSYSPGTRAFRFTQFVIARARTECDCV